jgi:hypothetical protein
MVNKMKTSNAKRETTTKQSNINQHSEKRFSEVLNKALVKGGIHANASKGHGKTRLLFSMAKHLRMREDCRVYIFDGSEAWLYGFDRIPVLTITERDITLAEKIRSIEQIERYTLENWELTKLAIAQNKDLLFRLKTRKPSKRGFFVRTVVNYLDRIQREQRATTKTHEPKNYIAYFIEEAQNAFNSRSTVRLEAEEYLSVFNEARNQKEAFFTASQRLNDFSKTIRTKQLYCIGRINAEDKTTFLRRIEKTQNIDFSAMPQRTWFFEGETFVSPTWTQQGKPYQINRALRAEFMKQQPKKKKSLISRILSKLTFGASDYNNETEDKSVYSEDPEATQEDDMEEDLALLNDNDMGW